MRQPGITQHRSAARQSRHFRSHKGLDRVATRHLANGARRDHQPLRTGHRDQTAIDFSGAPGDAVVGTDKTGHKRCLRLVIKLLRCPHLLKTAVVHDRHMVRQHQRFRLVMGDVDKGGAKRGLQSLQLNLHVLT